MRQQGARTRERAAHATTCTSNSPMTVTAIAHPSPCSCAVSPTGSSTSVHAERPRRPSAAQRRRRRGRAVARAAAPAPVQSLGVVGVRVREEVRAVRAGADQVSRRSAAREHAHRHERRAPMEGGERRGARPRARGARLGSAEVRGAAAPQLAFERPPTPKPQSIDRTLRAVHGIIPHAHPATSLRTSWIHSPVLY